MDMRRVCGPVLTLEGDVCYVVGFFVKWRRFYKDEVN